MLWIEFVNSLARDPVGRAAPVDQLEDPVWVRQFAQKYDLLPVQLRQRSGRDQLRDLRQLLQDWVLALVHKRPVPSKRIDALNEYLTRRPVRPQLDRRKNEYRLDLVPDAKGSDTWLFAVAVSFARFLVEADPGRLKLCDNSDCCWVFYDTTRSRTRRWCATGCGDLIKVREFRRRHTDPDS